jgi:hypothetical protein
MYKIMQSIWIFLQENHVSLYVNTSSLAKFDGKKIISKFQRFENLDQKATTKRTFVFTIWLVFLCSLR